MFIDFEKSATYHSS